MPTYWACAQTHPREEDVALRNLRRQGFISFFPYFLGRRFTRGGIPTGVYIAKPAFPSYVFIRLNDDTHWSPINSTTGVTRLLTYQGPGEYREPCRADFIDELWQNRVMQADRKPDLIPVNTMVRITRGPFSERVALVTMSTETRIGLVLEMFSREIVVELEVEAVEILRRPTA